MSFGLGGIELILVAVVFVIVAILICVGHSMWRWAAALLACASVASIVTPADPASTIVLGTLLFLFFYCGMRFERFRSVCST